MRFDLEGEVSRLNYTDGNKRTAFGANLMYRVLTTQPVLRVGLSYRRDDTSFESPLYYTPQDFNALSVLADYAFNRGRLRYGLTAAYPITGRGDDGNNRPAKRCSVMSIKMQRHRSRCSSTAALWMHQL
jgi:hypothetical protein